MELSEDLKAERVSRKAHCYRQSEFKSFGKPSSNPASSLCLLWVVTTKDTMAQQLSKFWRTVLFFGKGMEEDEKSAAITALAEGLQRFFGPRGFTYAKAYQAFRKKDGDLRFSFGLNLFLHADSFTIRPLAAIRHDAIERIFHRASGAPDTVQRDSGTVLWHWALGKRTPKPHSFTVDRSSRVTAGVEFSTQFFLEWVEPFFREHSDLVAISNSFNDGRKVLQTALATDSFDLLGRALIAAKLTRRGDYDALKSEYRRAFERRKSSHPLSSFDALVRVLEEVV